MRRVLDCTGSEMIPLRLIISISVIAVISMLTAQGFYHYTQIQQEETFMDSITRVQKNLEAMVRSGHPRDITDIHSPERTRQIHKLTVPPMIQKITFGSPMSNQKTHGNTGNTNTIVFYSQFSGKQVLWCDQPCYFVKGVYNETEDIWVPDIPFSSMSVSGSGSMTLSFELVTDGASIFILVYELIE